MTDAIATKRELARLTRLYAALSQVNQSIVWSSSRDELFPKVCRALVEHGGFGMAWIGWEDPGTRQLVPVAEFGDTGSYLKAVRIYTSEDRPEGRGPSGRAFREGMPYVANDLLANPLAQPWREFLERNAFRSSAVFPIRELGEVRGTLSVYSHEPDFFRDKEVELLAEAAMDVSFALGNFAREEERRRVEAEVVRERQISDSIIASLPGVLYLYDEQGKFLRWNDAFLTVSGYTADELTGMHPLDFFRGADRDLVASRIGEVFITGAASVEAGFATKDGRIIPYYFTGHRVVLDGKPCLVGVGIDISERVEAEEELRRSEERYHSTLDSIVEGGQLIGHDWRYLYLNDTAAVHNRRPNSELLGRTMQEAWPGIEQSEVYGMIRRCLEERVPVRGETEFHFADGSSAWYDVRCQPVPEGVFVLSIDISERKRDEAERLRLLQLERESHAKAEDARRTVDRILESVTDAFVSLDRTWRYTYVNERAARIFGRTREQLLGKHIWTEFPEGVGQPFHLAYERAMREGVQIQLEEYYPPYDRWFENRIYPHEDGISIVFQDITERKRAERALIEAKADLERKVEERTSELQSALMRAEAADQVKSAFLATMSHELRTPLNSIIGFTGIILQGLAGPLNEEQAKQLGMVRNSARHLLDLINDVLDISKIEAGQMAVKFAPFDLRASVNRVVESVAPMAERKGLPLRVTVPDTLPAMASDQRRVEQILLNLLNNAIKFTEHGGVTLIVDEVREVRGQPEPGIRLRVQDTGIGIKAQDLGTLFQPFRQVDTGLTRQHEGTGLGLAICRRLADLLGGEISAESTWGVGSVFTVTLPLNPEEPPA